jgi:hypothetical protein
METGGVMITENSFRTQPAEEAEPEKEIFKLFDHAETIRLSERDFALVEDLLENPPEPTPALLRAIRAKYGK